MMTTFAVIAAILFPAYANSQKLPNKAAQCMTNLLVLGRAFRIYASDYNGTFPTNRQWIPGSKSPGPKSREVLLSMKNYDPNGDGIPDRFECGVNFVESLYPYLNRSASLIRVEQVWKCPEAKDIAYPMWMRGAPPPTSPNARAAVTYAMNSYMVEVKEAETLGIADVMLLREMDARVNSVLRPTVPPPNAMPPIVPNCPFLDDTAPDTYAVMVKANLHLNGSHILFGDGHVRYFEVSRMRNSQITTQIDPDDRWTNRDGDIAITPAFLPKPPVQKPPEQ